MRVNTMTRIRDIMSLVITVCHARLITNVLYCVLTCKLTIDTETANDLKVINGRLVSVPIHISFITVINRRNRRN